jgi:hypothetical protein
MTTPVDLTPQEHGDEPFERRLARLRASPEERAQILASAPPFDYAAWVQEAGPAAPEELVEMEEFLRASQVERERSLALEQRRNKKSGA